MSLETREISCREPPSAKTPVEIHYVWPLMFSAVDFQRLRRTLRDLNDLAPPRETVAIFTALLSFSAHDQRRNLRLRRKDIHSRQGLLRRLAFNHQGKRQLA